jgi:hypothetical protein
MRALGLCLWLHQGQMEPARWRIVCAAEVLQVPYYSLAGQPIGLAQSPRPGLSPVKDVPRPSATPAPDRPGMRALGLCLWLHQGQMEPARWRIVCAAEVLQVPSKANISHRRAATRSILAMVARPHRRIMTGWHGPAGLVCGPWVYACGYTRGRWSLLAGESFARLRSKAFRLHPAKPISATVARLLGVSWLWWLGHIGE